MNKNLLKFRFEAKKGERTHRYYDSVTIDWDHDLWWNKTHKRFEPINTTKDSAYSSHAPCKTFKAFKRMLRKHPQIIGIAILVSRYEDSNIYSL